MANLTVSTHTYDRVTDLAKAWRTTEDGAIVRLIDAWKGASTSSRDGKDEIRVHVVYRGERADGIYHPSTGLIDIVSGLGSKATGLKPSPAAGEVIRAVNTDRGKTVTGSRNGWDFWVVTTTGEPLQSIRSKA